MILKIFSLVTIILFWTYSIITAQNIFVAVNGSDASKGTIDSPMGSISAAVNLLQAGDTIFVRGGIYGLSSTISISKAGTSEKMYYLFAYPGERPVLDFSSMAVSSSNRGIYLKKNYWYIKGLDIKGAGDNGMMISSSNNIIEFCSFYENRDTGLQLGGGASNNRIINCDSYYNADPGNGNADGFSPKLDVGSGNYFYGCRSWQNSDDGWDGYLRPSDNVTTTLENCWCFDNGYLKSGKASTGNGNGFKMGGSDTKLLRHNFILKDCVAFDNRVKGFDQNNNKGSMTLYNCSAYRNGTNYSIYLALADSAKLTVVNCLALGAYGILGDFAVQKTNGWQTPFNVTNDDFISIDTTGIRGARKVDGSLPGTKFLHLAPGSDLINAGTDIGLPFIGSAPDLGAFEFDPTTEVTQSVNNKPSSFELEQNYPNPFNPATSIKYTIAKKASVKIVVYDLLGREVSTLVNENKEPGNYKINFDGSKLSSGVYLYVLSAGQTVSSKKMILLK